MLADYFTKPLQGQLFRLFREIIMNWKPLSVLLESNSIKERVGEQDKIMSEIKSCNNDDVASGVELVNGKEKPMLKTYRDVLVNS